MDPELGVPTATIAFADHVAAIARELGIDSAVIGGIAVAAHGYPRMTADVDLATATDPFGPLRQLADRLDAEGCRCSLSLPDAEDSLGGVLTIESDRSLPVQLVNYFNPFRAARNPGRESIATAIRSEGLSSLKIVDLPHLIALKLYAGGPKNDSDVIELCRRHPEIPRVRLREVCEEFDLGSNFDRVLATAT